MSECSHDDHGLRTILLSSSRAQYGESLREENLESLFEVLNVGGRPKLLDLLKSRGVSALSDRQAIANAVSRAKRDGLPDLGKKRSADVTPESIPLEDPTPPTPPGSYAPPRATPGAAMDVEAPAAAAAPSVSLRDGRMLAYREYGEPSGVPVIFFHGNGNSRLHEPMFEKSQQATADAGVRLIAVDRPGVGESSAHAERSYASSVEDTRELADALGLSSFVALGYSSGGPHALACGALLPASRLLAVGAISSDGPYWLMRGEAAGAFDAPIEQPFSDPKLSELDEAIALAKVKHAENVASYKKWNRPGPRLDACLADTSAAIAQGWESVAKDFILERGDWGFPVESGAPVLLWHGANDDEVHPQAARYTAKLLGDAAKLRVLEKENHTMLRRHWGNFLKELVDVAKEDDLP